MARAATSIGRRAATRERPGARPAATRAGSAPRSALHLDRLIHERLRLGIVSALAVNERLTFHTLKGLLQTTDGNLIVHARKLEDADYVRSEKSKEAGVSRTEYRLTPAGRKALERYLEHIEAIIAHAKRGS